MEMTIPKGWYTCDPAKKLLKKDDKGRDHALVALEIAEGDYTGETLWWRGWLHTDGSAKVTIDTLKKFGCTFPGGQITSDEGFGDNQVRVRVSHRKHNGKTYPEIKAISTRGGGGGLSEDEAQRFNSRFAGMFGGGEGAGEPGDAPAGAGGYGDSDIPF